MSWFFCATSRQPKTRAISSAGTHPLVLIAGIGVWTATFSNFVLWAALYSMPEHDGLIGALFVATFIVFVASAHVALLTLVAWGPLLRPTLSIFVLSAAGGAYFMGAYGVVIDPRMMVNVLQTDLGEARDLLALEMAIAVLLLAAIPLAWVWTTRVRRATMGRRLVQRMAATVASLLVLVMSLMLMFQPFASTMRNHPQVRYLINPLNSVYSLVRATYAPFERKRGPPIALGEDATIAPVSPHTQPPLLLLVVGETARSANFSINGYGRRTTPQLAQRDDVFSARNAWSCGTSTAESLPCMFSHLGRDAFFNRQSDYENLLDVLQRVGLAVLWLDNQSGCKGVCARIETQSADRTGSGELCPISGECLDTAMLNGLDARIRALPPDRLARGTVIVLHQMGSHGPAYFKRSANSRKYFQPECRQSALHSCERDEVVNAYDNSIVETDHLLATAIQWMEKSYPGRPVAMMYVSDHGESLGEKNLYLHGLPYALAPDTQKNVPWILWMSTQMQQRSGADIPCLQQVHGNGFISHDNFFHTVLGTLGVRSRVYDERRDLLTACRRSASRTGS